MDLSSFMYYNLYPQDNIIKLFLLLMILIVFGGSIVIGKYLYFKGSFNITFTIFDITFDIGPLLYLFAIFILLINIVIQLLFILVILITLA